MANVPQILASPRIEGNLRVSASPQYNAGLGMMARGLGDVADAARTVGAVIERGKAIEKHNAEMQDADWVGEARTSFETPFREWQADPKNHTDPNYARTMKDKLGEMQSEWMANAPNPRAAKLFKKWADAFTVNEYDKALSVSLNNQVKKSEQTVGDNLKNLSASYRSTKGIPGENAVGEYLKGFDGVLGGINESFKFTPALAERHRIDAYQNMVALIAEDNIDAARKRVESSNDIPDDVRKSLLAQIKAQEPRISRGEQLRANKAVKDAINLAETTGQATDLDFGMFLKMNGGDKDAALFEYEQTSNLIAGSVAGHSIARNVAQTEVHKWGAQLQDNLALMEEEGDVKSIAGATAAKILQENRKTFESGDYAKFITDTDPRAAQLESAMNSTKRGTTEHAAASKEFFGYVLQREEDNFVPQDKRTMLPNDEAKWWVGQITASGPEKIQGAVADFQAQFADADMAAIATDQLARAGMPGAWQAGIMNNDQTWVGNYYSAQKNQFYTKGTLTEETKRQMREELDNNGHFLTYQQIQFGRGPEYGGQMAGMYDGVLNYAALFAQHGESGVDAVRKAAELVFTSKVAVIDSGDKGGSMTVPKGKFTDAEIQDLPRRFEIAKERLGMKGVSAFNPETFGFTEAMVKQDPDFAYSMMYNKLVSDGVWRDTADGRGKMLYLDNGADSVAVTDKEGRAFVLYLEDLPKFTTPYPEQFVGAGGMATVRVPAGERPEQPKGEGGGKRVRYRTIFGEKGDKAVELFNRLIPGGSTITAPLRIPFESYWPVPPGDDSYIKRE